MPLTKGRYPATYPIHKLLGLQPNATQSDLACRSNIEWFGLANPTDGALAGTGVGCAVPIPCEPGDTFTKIAIQVGATAGGTMTHQFAALYSGIAVPALIGQSTDTTSAAIGASAVASWSLSAPATITQAQCPNGFIYASLVIAASTVPTAVVVSIPTAIGYQWNPTGAATATTPLFLSATHGSALTTTAPATIASPAAKAVAPLVFLS